MCVAHVWQSCERADPRMSLLLGPFGGTSGNCILDRRIFVIVVPVADIHICVVGEHASTGFGAVAVVTILVDVVTLSHMSVAIESILFIFLHI